MNIEAVELSEDKEEEVIESALDSEEVQEESEPVEDNNDEETTEESKSESEESTDEEPKDDDEVVVSIGEDSPPEKESSPAPKWVKELRKREREQKKLIRDLEKKLEETKVSENKPVTLGPKPTLESFDYDSDKFEVEYDKWSEQKRVVAKQEESKKSELATQAKTWQDKLDNYNEQKTKLKVKDYDDAELTAQDELSTTQQALIISYAEKPELLIYVLGKNPKRLKELSQLTDNAKFAFEVSKLETQLKVSNKKRPETTPEKRVKSSGGAGSSDATLSRLRKEAETTGDYTKVSSYNRKLRNSKN